MLNCCTANTCVLQCLLGKKFFYPYQMNYMPALANASTFAFFMLVHSAHKM